MTENEQENTGSRGPIKQPGRLQGRFKWAVLAAAIIIGAVFLVNHFDIEIIPEPEGYPAATDGPFEGFYKGLKTEDSSLFFVFFEHPNAGIMPLYNYRTLNSDTIKLAVYAPGLKGMELTLNSWITVETENATITRDHRTQIVILDIMPGLELHEIDIPMSYERRDYQLMYGEEEIWVGQHITLLSHRPAPRLTLYEQTIDRVLYIVGGIFVAFSTIQLSGMLVKRVKVVPRVTAVEAMVALLSAGVILYFTASWYIMKVALRSATLTYIPVAAAAFFYGIYLLRPEYDRWYFLKLYDLNEIPAIEIWSYEVYTRGNEVLIASDYEWKDFLRGKTNKMMLSAQDKQPLWYFTVPSSSTTRVYYFDSIRENQYGTSVKLTSQHQKKIEQFKADIIGLESISKALTSAHIDLTRERADKHKTAIVEGARIAEEYLKLFLVGLGLREEEKETEQKKQSA